MLDPTLVLASPLLLGESLRSDRCGTKKFTLISHFVALVFAALGLAFVLVGVKCTFGRGGQQPVEDSGTSMASRLQPLSSAFKRFQAFPTGSYRFEPFHEERRNLVITEAAAAASSQEATSKSRSRKVAVVGAGSAGIVACRFLREYGHRPVVFEAASRVGGIWSSSPLNKVVYRNLVTNLPKVVMQSFDLDFPSEVSSYVEASDLGNYLESLADFTDVNADLELNARVIRIRPLRSLKEELSGEAAWEVSWEQNGAHKKDVFDSVLVANGHYSTPYLPQIPGQDVWLAGAPSGARTISHSVTFDDASDYAGRAVLVVGGRSSGVDLALRLKHSAKFVYVLDKSCSRVTVVGTCMHIPLGAELVADGHISYQGALLQGPPVDDLVLATGYRYEFPFLDTEEVEIDFDKDHRSVSPLYMHVIHAKRPSLAFMGVPLAIPAPIPLFEAEARFIANRWCYNGAYDEDVAMMESWVAARKRLVGNRPQDMHVLPAYGCSPWEHMRNLTRLSGMGEAEFRAYCGRLGVVASIYEDAKARKPKLPWDDDSYRRYEYSANWSAQSFTVQGPEYHRS